MAGRSIAAVCVVLGLPLSAASAPQPAERPTRSAAAVKTTEPIQVDGRLDEDAWHNAPPIGELIQREPKEGGEPSERTTVRILFTERALYVGVMCFDRSPREIVATQLARDSDLDVDDRITIVLDPFFDHRNGFFFQVNPAGARSDGQVSNNAESLSTDWDGIWNAAAHRGADGWSAEIEIPFKTLRFKPGQSVWGLNVERQIKRRQEIDRWAAARQNIWIGNLAEAGQLNGLDGVQQGAGLDVRPYGAVGRLDGDPTRAGGVDVFKNVMPNVNAAVTVNTDFAETEADLRRVNLTRFPLFFPEKRAFFLEGSGVFDVAGLAHTTDVIPFFSRRVGLLDGITVPIRVGVKLIGRPALYNIGVVDVSTGGLTDGALSTGSVAAQNLFAARISRNLFQQSWIGAIVTHGDPAGERDNTLVGADVHLGTSTFRGTKNLAFEAFLLGTDNGGTRDGAGGLRLDYPNDRWDIALNWRQIGDGFEPALGFVPRAGIRTTDLSFAFQPRPQQWGVRQLFFQANPVVVTDLRNRLESASVTASPVNLQAESGDHVEWDVIPEFERLGAPFNVASGVVIPPGDYRWTQFRSQLNTATKRSWVIDAICSWGGFYDGQLRQFAVTATLKVGLHAAVSAHVEQNAGTLPEGRFSTELVTLRGDVNLTPNVSWAALAQFDNQSNLVGLQSRVRWILQPGNDLFVVVNRGWRRTVDGSSIRFEPLIDQMSVKLQYTLRL